MRSLILLALAVLAALPLAAHERGFSRSRGRIEFEASRAPYHRLDRERWEHRGWERRDWERQAWRRSQAWDEECFPVRPRYPICPPPFGVRLELRLR
jgi:hypothetical protein